jgi:hypothetical protein
MQEWGPSETLVSSYLITRRHIQDDNNFWHVICSHASKGVPSDRRKITYTELSRVILLQWPVEVSAAHHCPSSGFQNVLFTCQESSDGGSASHKSFVYTEQDRQCTHLVTPWRVRVIFVLPQPFKTARHHFIRGEFFYGDFMSPATVCRNSGLRVKCPIFTPDFNQIRNF